MVDGDIDRARGGITVPVDHGVAERVRPACRRRVGDDAVHQRHRPVRCADRGHRLAVALQAWGHQPVDQAGEIRGLFGIHCGGAGASGWAWINGHRDGAARGVAVLIGDCIAERVYPAHGRRVGDDAVDHAHRSERYDCGGHRLGVSGPTGGHQPIDKAGQVNHLIVPKRRHPVAGGWAATERQADAAAGPRTADREDITGIILAWRQIERQAAAIAPPQVQHVAGNERRRRDGDAGEINSVSWTEAADRALHCRAPLDHQQTAVVRERDRRATRPRRQHAGDVEAAGKADCARIGQGDAARDRIVAGKRPVGVGIDGDGGEIDELCAEPRQGARARGSRKFQNAERRIAAGYDALEHRARIDHNKPTGDAVERHCRAAGGDDGARILHGADAARDGNSELGTQNRAVVDDAERRAPPADLEVSVSTAQRNVEITGSPARHYSPPQTVPAVG